VIRERTVMRLASAMTVRMGLHGRGARRETMEMALASATMGLMDSAAREALPVTTVVST
jgi:hypothetical protein